tara:strand:+ start:2462 stop:2827 length:366 start_codon:yes stop_codon:yes gene_type:complete
MENKITLKELRNLPTNFRSKEIYGEIILFYSGESLKGMPRIAMMSIAGYNIREGTFEIIAIYDYIMYDFGKAESQWPCIQQSMLLPSRASLIRSRSSTNGFRIKLDESVLTLEYVPRSLVK